VVKSGRCVRLISPKSWAIVMKSGNLNFLETSGHLGPVMGLLYQNVKTFTNTSRVNGTRAEKCLEANRFKTQRASLNADRVADEEDAWFL